jgi:hypothetical protein
VQVEKLSLETLFFVQYVQNKCSGKYAQNGKGVVVQFVQNACLRTCVREHRFTGIMHKSLVTKLVILYRTYVLVTNGSLCNLHNLTGSFLCKVHKLYLVN